MCTIASLHAQWTSEGIGRTYTLMDLAEIEGTGVTYNGDNTFHFNNDITIHGDNLVSLGSTAYTNIIFANGVTLEVVQGNIDFNWVEMSSNGNYAIRIGETQTANLNHTNMSNCGGITVYDTNLKMIGSLLRNFSSSFASSAISLMNSTATIFGCNFYYNASSAIGSAANGNSSISISYCDFYHNGTGNENRPQINLGPGSADTIFITNCNILGEYNNVGSISIANLTGNAQTTNVVIDSCEITGNRYGINLQGYNINALVTNSKIKNNNLETNPMNGGSGISIYGVDENCKAKLRNNTISGNLWGITSINKNSIDLGTADDWGGNYIYDNGNGGITYALYNNASTDISAIGNYWGTNDISEVENVIYHRPDLGDDYGLVIYEPITLPHPQLISLSCLREDNCPDEPIPDCKGENCDKNKSCFLGEDLTGFVNEFQHTVYLYYDGVLSDHEEFHNLILRYELGELCNGLPESGTSFQFDDLYQSQLIVSTPFGESETWTIQLMETESIAEQEDAEKLTIVPTPAHDKVWICMDANSHFTVTDLTGRKVFEGKSNSDKTELDIQNWESGIYIINAIKDGRQKSGRIVVY